MDMITQDNLRTSSSRLSMMHPHMAAADVNQLDAFDAGELRHVASFLRESRNNSEWWRVHIFAAANETVWGDQTVCFTRSCDGEIYRSNVWGDSATR